MALREWPYYYWYRLQLVATTNDPLLIRKLSRRAGIPHSYECIDCILSLEADPKYPSSGRLGILFHIREGARVIKAYNTQTCSRTDYFRHYLVLVVVHRNEHAVLNPDGATTDSTRCTVPTSLPCVPFNLEIIADS